VDVITFIGILVAGGMVAGSIIMGGEGAWFINYPSLLIVVGGTMGATFLAHPVPEVLKGFKVAKDAFIKKGQLQENIIRAIVGCAKTARREGILSFDRRLHLIGDSFLARGLQLAIDGMESQEITEIMNTEIQNIEERRKLDADIFTTMGTFAPAVGMLGTIVGLIQMLMQMKDPSQIGAPMAVALLTTFYGILLANLFFLPIAGKLRTRSKEEVINKQMIIEGIIAIQAGDNHRIVEHKMKAFLAPEKS
jgi:chemotaxis protein MotA